MEMAGFSAKAYLGMKKTAPANGTVLKQHFLSFGRFHLAGCSYSHT